MTRMEIGPTTKSAKEDICKHDNMKNTEKDSDIWEPG